MKRERYPTREELDKLLLWFKPDREEAGEQLRLIGRRLIQIFASRGCVDAECLADEVVHRVAVRIDTVTQNYPDPVRCCLGFVDNVYREYLRDEQKKAAAKPPPPHRPEEELEREDECLSRCLGDLPPPDRELVVRYFQHQKRAKIVSRQKLAAELNLTANGLRIKAHRLRKRLLGCLQICLEQA